MKIYKERNNKSRTTCYYCYDTTHNRRYCPHLKAHYEMNKNYCVTREVVGIDGSHFHSRLGTISKIRAKRHFEAWFDYAHSVHSEHAKKQKEIAKAKAKPRKARKCGFCRSEDHTRRACTVMSEFVEVLEQTNLAYRKMFYEQIIEGLGLGKGAVVQMEREIGWQHKGKEKKTAIITKFDPDSIGIGNLLQYSDYETPIEINNKERSLGDFRGFLSKDVFPSKVGKEMSHLLNGHEWHWRITKIVAPSPTKPDRDWFLGQSPAFSWVVKKRDYSQLRSAFSSIVKSFHPKGSEALKNFQEIT